MALRTPPSAATVRSASSPGKRRVPLNIMCSTQWLMPVFPGRSCRDPTRYHTHHDTSGAVCTSCSSTVSPFASRVLVTPDLAITLLFDPECPLDQMLPQNGVSPPPCGRANLNIFPEIQVAAATWISGFLPLPLAGEGGRGDEGERPRPSINAFRGPGG